MRRRCPDAELVGAGIVKDYELLFKGSGSGSYATIEEKARDKVPVLVWRISASDEEALDRYEGFPTFYYKTQLPVKMAGWRRDHRHGLHHARGSCARIPVGKICPCAL